MDVIHICFGIHDGSGNYCKYMAATMISVLRNTKEYIVFHVLHDTTLLVEYKRILTEMIDRYDNSEIRFHEVEIDEKDYEEYDLKRFTIGTLFKLMICKKLRETTERAIYLDSDIIVNLDIVNLWKEELNGKLLGAVNVIPKDTEIWPLLRKEIVKDTEYYNTGMMLLDIKAICNKHDMWGECIDFILNKSELWRAPDQDAITYIFRGEIKALPEVYNIKVSEYRGKGKIENCIFHFIADNPRDTFEYLPDQLFYEALKETYWGTEDKIINHYEKRIAEKDDQKEVVYKMMKAVYEKPPKKKVFWGVRGDIHKSIMDKLPWNNNDYFVDKNKLLWGEKHLNGFVFSPEKLKEENIEDTIVIVTVFRYREIKIILEKYGYIENVNFFNGKFLLSEHQMYTLNGDRESKWDL